MGVTIQSATKAGGASLALAIGLAGGVTMQAGQATAVPPAPAFKAATSVRSTSANATCTYPAGIAAGDVLTLVVYCSSSVVTATTPSGWTQALYDSTTQMTYVYKKIADGSETGSFNVVLSNSTPKVTTIADYSGATTVEVGTLSHFSSTSSVSAPSISPASTGVLTAYYSCNSTTSVSSGPAGMTLAADSTTSSPRQTSYYQNNSGSPSGSKSATLSQSDTGNAFLIQVY